MSYINEAILESKRLKQQNKLLYNNKKVYFFKFKTAEEVLKSKLNPVIAILNNSDYTFNKVIEAMEEYAKQFKKKS